MLSGQYLQVPMELYVFGERLGLDATDAMIVMAIERFRRYRPDWHMSYEDIAGFALVSERTVRRRVPILVKRGLVRCKVVYYRGNNRGFTYDTEPLWDALADVAREAANLATTGQSGHPTGQFGRQTTGQSGRHTVEVEALEELRTTTASASNSSKNNKASSSKRKSATPEQRELIEQLGYERDVVPRNVNDRNEANEEIRRLMDLPRFDPFADDDEWGDDEKVYRTVLSPEMEAIQNGRADVEPARTLHLAGTATAA